jgi:hypothetical protein
MAHQPHVLTARFAANPAFIHNRINDVAGLTEMKSNTKSCSYFAQRGERPPEFQAAPPPFPIVGTANLMCPP